MAMNEVSPVTEAEVQTFAQRIVTTIVSASHQAHQLIELQGQMDAIGNRLNKLYDENAKLKTEMAEAWEFVKTVEAERDQAKRNAELSEARVAESQQDAARAYTALSEYKDNANGSIAQLTATVEAKEARIYELERELGQANSHVTSLKATNEEQAFRIVKQAESLTHKNQQMDKLYVDLNDAVREHDVSETKLGIVQAKLNDLRSLFDSPKEVAAPLEQIQSFSY